MLLAAVVDPTFTSGGGGVDFRTRMMVLCITIHGIDDVNLRCVNLQIYLQMHLA